MTAVKPGRLVALDVLRGLAVAGMILVVSPGDWAHRYAQLDHAAWNGATVADMVFPAFLFGVGVALGLSFPRALETAAERRQFRTKLIRRAIVLVLLGLAVEASYVAALATLVPFPDGGGWLGHVRIPGILQRIGLCYALAGALLAATARRDAQGVARLNVSAILLCAAAILILYWLALALIPVPGVGAGVLTPGGALPGYVDRMLFTEPHLWPLGSATAARPATYDPEGLLSTLPATTNVLFGALAAWAAKRDPATAPVRIATAGGVLIAAALAVDPVVVINKRLWTSSFALLSSGVPAIGFALLLVAMRSRIIDTASTPLRVLGGNAILAFLLSTLMSRLSMFPLIPGSDGRISVQEWGYHQALALVADPRIASLLCAIGVLAFVTLLIWPLHRRAIHFRL